MGETALLLLRHGADVNHRCGMWDTDHCGSVLHQACKTGNVAMVRLLLSAGADIRARNSAGRLPRQCTRDAAIRQLIDRYAQDGSGTVQFRNVSFETALARCRAVRLEASVVRTLLLAT